MDSMSSELAELQEQLQDLEKLRKLLGDALTDQKKAELEARRQALLNMGGGAIVGGNVHADGDFVGRDKHVHYHGDDSVAKAKQAEADYRREVADHCGTLPLRGVDTTAGSTTAETLSLAHVYISLDTRQSVPAKALAEALQAVAEGKTEPAVTERFSRLTEREDTRPYKSYPYDPSDGRNDPEAEGRPVVRGGAWGRAQGSARAASRGRDPSDFWDSDGGFRVVLSLANSEF